MGVAEGRATGGMPLRRMLLPRCQAMISVTWRAGPSCWLLHTLIWLRLPPANHYQCRFSGLPHEMPDIPQPQATMTDSLDIAVMDLMRQEWDLYYLPLNT